MVKILAKIRINLLPLPTQFGKYKSMNISTKRIYILAGIVLAIAVGIAILLTRTQMVERVKQESAKLFDYEYIPNQHIKLDSCEVSLKADSIYKDFRKKYRFHYQTIGLASFADSSRLILLSDLPPHFEMDSIAPIFSKFTHRVEVRHHGIGYDGYVTDVLILLGNATSENCEKLISRLNEEMFFSDYKPAITTLPVAQKRKYFASENIDYQISLYEFNSWFIEEGELFITLEDTSTAFTVPDMLKEKKRGVFFSQLPGFVAWAIGKHSDIGEQLSTIRQFTLDADLILGGISDSSTLIVIGRERQSPLYELPPLQIETILLLASTTEKELSQSLDINDLMAGKMNNGKDWCPTYLSKELENTEFGDLMTMTDILLKDWSERGTIRESHYAYPEPGYYPFDKPLFRKLGLNELVYNWNTAGAMYAIDQDGYTLYTLNRTGSLPVSYFNSQERSESIGYRYEAQAYHYFATLMNTDLARVVQYTALYQLFIDNDIQYKGNTYPAFPKNKPFLLYRPTCDLLNCFKNMNSEQMQWLADSLSHRSFSAYQKEQVDKQLRQNERDYNMSYSDDNIDFIYKDVHRNTKEGYIQDFAELKSMLNGLSESQFKKLARYLAYPRGVTINSQETYATYLRARKVNQLMRAVGKNNLDLIGMDLNQVKNYFVSNLAKSAGRYTKTPSVIITYNDMVTTGGHNLSSKISRVNSMTNYKRTRSYTPTDYEKPATGPNVADNQPSAPSSAKPSSEGTPAGAKPSGSGTPTTSKPTSSASPSKSGSPSKPSTTSSKTSSSSSKSTSSASNKTSSSNANGVRPRSAVISTAARGQRGF